MEKMLLNFFKSIGFETIDISNFQITNAPMQEGEVVMGDMNELEKTCSAFLDQCQDKTEKLIEKLMFTEDGSDDELATEKDLSVLNKAGDIVKGMLWASIYQRFDAQKDSSGWGLREGNKVVKMPKKEKRSLSGLQREFMIIGVRGH
jgi:chemotaxis protein CheY-P-specific phosphatase CheC